MTLLFVHNQHSEINNSFYNALAKNLFARKKISSHFLFLKKNDKDEAFNYKSINSNCYSFEDFYKNNFINRNVSIEDFIKKYPDINWAQIVSSERAFSDFSMLLGSTGNRKEDLSYVRSGR